MLTFTTLFDNYSAYLGDCEEGVLMQLFAIMQASVDLSDGKFIFIIILLKNLTKKFEFKLQLWLIYY